MDTITISREERDQLRNWLDGLEGLLDDLRTSLLAGRPDVGELRERLQFGFGILDEIGWELQGSVGRYKVTVTPALIDYLSLERDIAADQASWGKDGPPTEFDFEALTGRNFAEVAQEERAKGATELAVAERILAGASA